MRLVCISVLGFVSGRAMACPSCAASTSASSGGAGVWWIVGAFLLVPMLIALAVAAAVRRETRAWPEVPK